MDENRQKEKCFCKNIKLIGTKKKNENAKINIYFKAFLCSYNWNMINEIRALEKNEIAKIIIYQNQKEKCFCKNFLVLNQKEK